MLEDRTEILIQCKDYIYSFIPQYHGSKSSSIILGQSIRSSSLVLIVKQYSSAGSMQNIFLNCIVYYISNY
jgi:hypothetical protein